MEFCSIWLEEDGYSNPLMHWLFALMCAVEKPLDPDVCSAIRCIARNCMDLKQKATKPETIDSDDNKNHLDLVTDWFVCAVVDYFGQKDLIC